MNDSQVVNNTIDRPVKNLDILFRILSNYLYFKLISKFIDE